MFNDSWVAKRSPYSRGRWVIARPNQPWYRGDKDAWVSKIGGKQVTLSKGRSSKQEAIRALYRILEKREDPRRGKAGLTILVLCDLFLDDVKARRADLTVVWYKRYLTYFLDHVGRESHASTLRPHHVTSWLASRAWGDTTRAGAVTAVKRLFRWAKREGYLKENLFEDVEKPTPRPRERIMDADQAIRVIGAARDQQFRDLLTILAETGCRPSEAVVIDASMLGGGVVTMESKTSRRTGRKRIIYLTETASRILADLAEKYPEGPLLRNRSGAPWIPGTIVKRFDRMRKRLGMGSEATAESFRHAFATDGLERGVPIATMAELMGHTSTNMISKTYSKLFQRTDHLKEAVKKVRGGE